MDFYFKNDRDMTTEDARDLVNHEGVDCNYPAYFDEPRTSEGPAEAICCSIERLRETIQGC